MRILTRISLFSALIVLLLSSCVSKKEERTLHIFATTDVHGYVFDKDPYTGNTSHTSMARLETYLKGFSRDEYILLDNGDNLQGNPSVYYYNFEDTTGTHLWARVLNYFDYNAVTAGNHDIEAGHAVYDRIRNQYDFPMLAANAVSVSSGKPYFTPYTIIEQKGLKVAVLGLITPRVPDWLPEVLYKGIEFRDMVETAAEWMPQIKRHNPDLVIGLFHAGWDEEYSGEAGSYMNENASMAVAREVPGFDIVMMGHDHDTLNKYIENTEGERVLLLDGGSRASYLQVARVVYKPGKKNKELTVEGDIIDLSKQPAGDEFIKHFATDYDTVRSYVSRRIGSLQNSVSSRESFFGDSEFMDLIHTVQLEISDADISFAAPLSFDVEIEKGDLTVGDMFQLYRYENMLYTVELTGAEVDRYLEYSYGNWIATMNGPDGDLFETEYSGNRYRFKNRTYNFDSAEGINYVVDVSKPDGDKVYISTLTDGREFDEERIYKVALNSYRGNGGGGHLKYAIENSGKSIDDIMLGSTEKDLRYFMINRVGRYDNLRIEKNNNWLLKPVDWVENVKGREYNKLFENE